MFQVENVETIEPDHIKFDFLGKDSIRYENTVQVHKQVFALVEQFCKRDQHNKSTTPVPSIHCSFFPSFALCCSRYYATFLFSRFLCYERTVQGHEHVYELVEQLCKPDQHNKSRAPIGCMYSLFLGFVLFGVYCSKYVIRSCT
jgi:hypothetical protein